MKIKKENQLFTGAHISFMHLSMYTCGQKAYVYVIANATISHSLNTLKTRNKLINK